MNNSPRSGHSFPTDFLGSAADYGLDEIGIFISIFFEESHRSLYILRNDFLFIRSLDNLSPYYKFRRY